MLIKNRLLVFIIKNLIKYLIKKTNLFQLTNMLQLQLQYIKILIIFQFLESFFEIFISTFFFN